MKNQNNDDKAINAKVFNAKYDNEIVMRCQREMRHLLFYAALQLKTKCPLEITVACLEDALPLWEGKCGRYVMEYVKSTPIPQKELIDAMRQMYEEAAACVKQLVYVVKPLINASTVEDVFYQLNPKMRVFTSSCPESLTDKARTFKTYQAKAYSPFDEE